MFGSKRCMRERKRYPLPKLWFFKMPQINCDLREFKLEKKTPLYNLQELQEKPTHPVLIVQGEKT